MNGMIKAQYVSLPLQKVSMKALLWNVRHLVQRLVLTCCLIIWLVLFFSLSSCRCLGWSRRYCGNRNGSVCVVWGTRFWDLSEQRWATNREWFRGCEKKLMLYLSVRLAFTFLWLMQHVTYSNPSYDQILHLSHIQGLWALSFFPYHERVKQDQSWILSTHHRCIEYSCYKRHVCRSHT